MAVGVRSVESDSKNTRSPIACDLGVASPLACPEDHLGDPVDQQCRVSLLPGLRGKAVIRSLDHSIGERMRLLKRRHVVGDHRRGNDVVVLRLNNQHVALEGRARTYRPVFVWADGEPPAASPYFLSCFGRAQSSSLRRHAQGEPTHWPKRGQDRGQVTAVAAAHHGDRFLSISGWRGRASYPRA